MNDIDELVSSQPRSRGALHGLRWVDAVDAVAAPGEWPHRAIGFQA